MRERPDSLQRLFASIVEATSHPFASTSRLQGDARHTKFRQPAFKSQRVDKLLGYSNGEVISQFEDMHRITS